MARAGSRAESLPSSSPSVSSAAASVKPSCATSDRLSARERSASPVNSSLWLTLPCSEPWCENAARIEWVVYIKPPFGGPHRVLKYLARYTHRVAISNHRLRALENGRVSFEWKDYAHHSRTKTMTLDAIEFIRRFLLHVLPTGLVRIRQFGFLANSCRTARLSLARQLLTVTPKPREPCGPAEPGPETWRCPRCGAAMRIGPNLTPSQLASRCSFFDSS